LAACAHIWHAHTAYDRLLGAGWTRQDARLEVAAEVNQILEHWRGVGHQ